MGKRAEVLRSKNSGYCMSCGTSSVIIRPTRCCVAGPGTDGAKHANDPARTERLPECVGDVVEARELRSIERHDAGRGGSSTKIVVPYLPNQKTVRPSNLADGDLAEPQK